MCVAHSVQPTVCSPQCAALLSACVVRPYLAARRAGRPLGLEEEGHGDDGLLLEAGERLPRALGLLAGGLGGAQRGGGSLRSALQTSDQEEQTHSSSWRPVTRKNQHTAHPALHEGITKTNKKTGRDRGHRGK